MKICEKKLNDFLNFYLGALDKNNDSLCTISSLIADKFNLGCYKSPSMNFIKVIKDYGFIRKYEVVCHAVPYVSAIRPDLMEVKYIIELIHAIYDGYLWLIKTRLWRIAPEQTYFQEFALFVLL